MSLLPPLVLAAVFPALVLSAGLKDATSFTIPNRLTLLSAAAFFPVAWLAGVPWPAVAMAVGVGAGALALGVAMFALGWIGGGDAKLLAACGLWLGLTATGPFLLVTALAGGLLATALLFARRLAPRLPLAGPFWLRRLLTEGEAVPYGVAIAAGALAAFPQSPVMRALGA